jgi:hypothetical protein
MFKIKQNHPIAKLYQKQHIITKNEYVIQGKPYNKHISKPIKDYTYTNRLIQTVSKTIFSYRKPFKNSSLPGFNIIILRYHVFFR